MSRVANLFGHNVGTGLTRHIGIIQDCLVAAGYDVILYPVPVRKRGARVAAMVRKWRPAMNRATVNIFVQNIVPSWFHRARSNVLFPMQEWFDPKDLPLLSAIDHVICASQHAEDIFAFRGPASRNIGFTCIDRQLPHTNSRRTGILHVAGRSPYKGTRTLLDVWSRHPEWPTLTLVHAPGVAEERNLPNVHQRVGHLEDMELRQMQNDAWLHIVPTEAEAFGHSLCEAFSVGALVVTTDAPPMNELVTGSRGVLVPYRATTRLNLGHRFEVGADALEQSVGIILDNGPAHYSSLMNAGRAWYLDNDVRVRTELSQFLRSLP